jgi:hypothetical protein
MCHWKPQFQYIEKGKKWFQGLQQTTFLSAEDLPLFHDVESITSFSLKAWSSSSNSFLVLSRRNSFCNTNRHIYNVYYMQDLNSSETRCKYQRTRQRGVVLKRAGLDLVVVKHLSFSMTLMFPGQNSVFSMSGTCRDQTVVWIWIEWMHGGQNIFFSSRSAIFHTDLSE